MLFFKHVGQSSCRVAEVQRDACGCRAQGQVHSSDLLSKATCGEHVIGLGLSLAPHEGHDHPETLRQWTERG